ncbi:GyrI-like domain-containing protein [Arthrobacter sp. SRS-W-1-2016]|uniref:GyrI-like domain-containing protein n=1 Tax=Arthrobacter sp. SRS-W-1-2016 TaxID=1930254 RepID=UPI00344C8D50
MLRGLRNSGVHRLGRRRSERGPRSHRRGIRRLRGQVLTDSLHVGYRHRPGCPPAHAGRRPAQNRAGRSRFGVEVTRTFETAGEVYASETPGGEAAVAVHHGPYHRMTEAYKAIEAWMAANHRESAGHSWRSTPIRPQIRLTPKRQPCTC